MGDSDILATELAGKKQLNTSFKDFLSANDKGGWTGPYKINDQEDASL